MKKSLIFLGTLSVSLLNTGFSQANPISIVRASFLKAIFSNGIKQAIKNCNKNIIPIREIKKAMENISQKGIYDRELLAQELRNSYKKDKLVNAYKGLRSCLMEWGKDFPKFSLEERQSAIHNCMLHLDEEAVSDFAQIGQNGLFGEKTSYKEPEL